MSSCRMPYDDVAWAESEEAFDRWKGKLFDEDVLRAIAALIHQHRGGGIPTELCAPTRGSFNACVRLKFLDGGSAIMRIPCPGLVMFPEEKTRDEVAVMRFIEHHTSIPVPHVLHYGMTDDCPHRLGPFIIMEYIEHAHDLVDALNMPGLGWQDRPILDPQIPNERLELVYSQMADILLQLAKCPFSRIGSVREEENDDDDTWTVTERPLTMNMNDLVCLAKFPRSELPSTTFETSRDYYRALADTHLQHLSTQRNDAVESASDCRRKYVARHLFRQLAAQGRLGNERSAPEPSRLFCDDLRPANVLVNADFQIVAVVDWEFTYVAPADFTYSPPWWLLLELPEYWPRGLSDWEATYVPRLETFLHLLEKQERLALETKALREPLQLASRMRHSWETGAFWVSYAARKSWAFDSIFWRSIDERFFGQHQGLEERLALLQENEQRNIDDFVLRKLAEGRGEGGKATTTTTTP
ncbi:MAG: hypothetical protein M1837_000799 [Sclerophora amabilis]|nr:MAG: hypothetical protein M1837_000799 [Sclerophora amabilis]